MKTEQLYGSFLPYFESLQLARWLTRLCDIQRRLYRNGKIPDNVADAAGHNARTLAPGIRPAGISIKELDRMQNREEKLSKLSPEEKNSFLSQEWEEVEAKITSGEIDIWDDTPQYTDTQECQRFLNDSLTYLRTKIAPAANPKESFLEELLQSTLRTLEADPTPHNLNSLRGYQCLLTLWDTARMEHEGKPPYNIKFSDQVAEALGIDPVVEESRLATNYALPQLFVRHAIVAARVAKKHLPQYATIILQLVNKLPQT